MTSPSSLDGGIMKPEARTDKSLLLKEIGGELIVYDTSRHEAHCLNPISALLWRHCDGETSLAQLAEILSESIGTLCDEDLVRIGLQQLSEAHLLKPDRTEKLESTPLTRRGVLRRLSLAGSAAVLTPLVISIVAPTPAMAQTALPNGSPCTSSSQCSSGCCNSGSLKCVGNGNCIP